MSVYTLVTAGHPGVGMASGKSPQLAVVTLPVLRTKVQSRGFMEQLTCPTEVSTRRMRIIEENKV